MYPLNAINNFINTSNTLVYIPGYAYLLHYFRNFLLIHKRDSNNFYIRFAIQ